MDQPTFKNVEHISATEISDALDSLDINGYLPNIKLHSAGKKLFGPVFTVKYQAYNSKPVKPMPAANYIDDIPAGSVILVDNQGKTDCSVWGEILTEYAQMKNIAGTVVNGAIRDIESISISNYPIFAQAICPQSGKNRVHMSAKQVPITINHINIHPQDYIYADLNGVLVIPRQQLSRVITLTHNIALNEKKIKQAIQSDLSLNQARKLYNYHTPWQLDENIKSTLES